MPTARQDELPRHRYTPTERAIGSFSIEGTRCSREYIFELALSPLPFSLQCAFTSVHLPNLLRAVRLNPAGQFSNPWLYTLRYLHHVADFARYCRTHVEAPLLLEYMLKHISSNITDSPQVWMDAEDRVSRSFFLVIYNSLSRS